MGLDMFLTRKERGEQVVEVAYWRRAWPIHDWFARKCGPCCNGVEVHPTVEQLSELLKLCEAVRPLRYHPDLEDELCFIPGAQDFYDSSFFDDAFWHKLEYTIQRLDEILEREGKRNVEGLKPFEYTYSASW